MAFTKVVGAGIHTLSNITSHNINSSGIITATKFVGPMENGSGISTFYDLRVTNNLTVDGTTTTLDTKLVEVDKIEVEADSTNVAIAVTHTGSGDILRLYDSASQVVTVDDEGNVGLGSAIPTKKLDVNGEVRITKTLTNAKITLSRNESVGIDDTPTGVIDFANNIAHTTNSRIQGVTDGTGNVGGQLLIETRDPSNSTLLEKLRITGAGRVGIGTDSPDRHVHIFDDGGGNRIMNIQGTATSGAFLAFLDANTTDDGSCRVGTKGGNKLSLRGDEHHFESGVGTSRMVIQSTGYVGINTTGLYPLDVLEPTDNAGLISITGKNTGYDTGFLIRNGSSPKWYLINDVSGSHAFEIRGDGWSNDRFFTLTQAGRVGIGTDNPNAQLDVYKTGTGTVVDTIITRTSGGGAFAVQCSDVAAANPVWALRTYSAEDLVLSPGGHADVNEKVRIKADTGRVGMGTAIPDAPLHILSDANNMLQIESTDRHSTMYLIDSIGSSFIQNDSGELRFGVGGGASAAGGETEVVRIDSNGLVGIGTDNPSKTLTIYGADSSSFRISKFGVLAYDHIFDGSTYEIKNNNGSAGIPLVIGTKTAGGESVRIDSAGLVGIGTDNLESKLTVAGNSATAQIEIKRTNTNSGGSIGALNFTAFDGHSVANMLALADGDNEGAHLIFKTTTAAGENSPYGDNTHERLRITNVGRVYIGGQSGRSPGGLTPQLQIEGIDVGTSSMSLTRNSANSGGASIILNKTRGTSVNADTAVKGNDTLGILQFAGNDGGDSDTAAAWVLAKVDDSSSQTMTSNEMPGRLEFHTRSDTSSGSLQERLRITSTGKVKIANHGTNDLRSLSVLAPQSQIQWGTAEDVGGFLMSTNNGQFGLSAGGYWNGSNWIAKHTASAQIRTDGDGDISFCSNTSLTSGNSFTPSEKMTITSTGEVGINNTNPQSALEVAELATGQSETQKRIAIFRKNGTTVGDEGYIHLTTMTGHYGVKLGFKNEGGSPSYLNQGFFISTVNSGETIDNHTKKFVIKSAGNVGIGTDNPGSKLHIQNGDLAVKQGALYLSSDRDAAVPGSSYGYQVISGYKVFPGSDTYVGLAYVGHSHSIIIQYMCVENGDTSKGGSHGSIHFHTTYGNSQQGIGQQAHTNAMNGGRITSGVSFAYCNGPSCGSHGNNYVLRAKVSYTGTDNFALHYTIKGISSGNMYV